MKSKRELIFAVLLIGFVWVSLFGRWLPTQAQNVLVYIVLLLAGTMIVAGWWSWRTVGKNVNIANWCKRVGLFGLIANTLAITIPVGSFFYMVFYPFIGLKHGLPMINWLLIAPTCFAFSLLGFIAGLLAPPRIRFATALGGLVVASIIVAIPMGIL